MTRTRLFKVCAGTLMLLHGVPVLTSAVSHGNVIAVALLILLGEILLFFI